MRGIIQTNSTKRPLALKKIMNTVEDDRLKNMLSSFSCVYDEDVQNFLRNRAIDFELLSKSRTYLIIDKEQF